MEKENILPITSNLLSLEKDQTFEFPLEKTISVRQTIQNIYFFTKDLRYTTITDKKTRVCKVTRIK